MTQTWCIVGGGMLGMTLAWRLARVGQAVTLIEAAPALGGLAGAWTLGDVTWDRHYHVILGSDSRWRRLLAELGLDASLEWRQTLTGFYAGGRHYSMSNSLEFLRFPPLGLIPKLRLGATIFHASRIPDASGLEDIPVETWLRRWSGNAAFERMWLPLLRSKLGDAYQRTSAAFIWATIARLYAARRSGLKRETFGYAPGGYARIIRTFEARLREAGVRIETGRPVESVSTAADGPRVTVGGEARRFDRVVCTLTPGLAARLITGLTDAERAQFAGVEYQGIVCASVLLTQPLTRYYVTNLIDGGLPFTGVIDMSALVDRREFGGHALVYLPKYIPPDDPLFMASDSEIEARFLAAIERMYPEFRRSHVLAFRVSRVREVFPVPVLGYSRKVPLVDVSASGVHCVSSAHIINGTLNVNETVALAEAEAERLLGRPRAAA